MQRTGWRQGKTRQGKAVGRETETERERERERETDELRVHCCVLFDLWR